MPARKKKTTVVELTPEDVRAAINKQFGPGTAKVASDPSLQITRIPTGLLAIDWRMGGGFPRNRYVELYGQEDVGKTALCYRYIANAQRLGLNCAFVDVEGTFDPEFAESLGVDLEALDYKDQHDIGGAQRIVTYMQSLLMSETYDVIVMDSIAALVPKEELEADNEKGSYGMGQAKLMSYALRKLTAVNKKTSMVFINQMRENVGGGLFAPKWRTSGGRAMKFYAGIRLELAKVETLHKKGRKLDLKTGEIKDNDKISKGHRILVKVIKNKTGGNAKIGDETTLVFDYDRGDFDEVEDLIFVGRMTGLVGKKGDKWWVDGYEDDKQHGRARFKKWLRKNRAIREELSERISEEDWPDEDDEEVDMEDALA